MSVDEGKRSTALSAATGGSGDTPIPWWVRIVVVLGALLMAAGGIIALTNPAMLASQHEEINGAVRIYAGYMASRNLALTAMLLAMLALGAKRALAVLMTLTALVQIFDACMDCVEARWPVVPGVLVFGIVFLAGAARLSGHPFWKREAWRSWETY